MGYVYSLKYENEVYVGETTRTPEVRFQEHKYNNSWVKELLAKGNQPELSILEQCEDQLNLETEKKWREIFRDKGFCIIEGVSNEGKSIKISDDLHQKIRILVAKQNTKLGDWVEAALQNRVDTVFGIKQEKN